MSNCLRLAWHARLVRTIRMLDRLHVQFVRLEHIILIQGRPLRVPVLRVLLVHTTQVQHWWLDALHVLLEALISSLVRHPAQLVLQAHSIRTRESPLVALVVLLARTVQAVVSLTVNPVQLEPIQTNRVSAVVPTALWVHMDLA